MSKYSATGHLIQKLCAVPMHSPPIVQSEARSDALYDCIVYQYLRPARTGIFQIITQSSFSITCPFVLRSHRVRSVTHSSRTRFALALLTLPRTFAPLSLTHITLHRHQPWHLLTVMSVLWLPFLATPRTVLQRRSAPFCHRLHPNLALEVAVVLAEVAEVVELAAVRRAGEVLALVGQAE